MELQNAFGLKHFDNQGLVLKADTPKVSASMGGRGEMIGTVHQWATGPHKKTSDGWIPVKEGEGGKKIHEMTKSEFESLHGHYRELPEGHPLKEEAGKALDDMQKVHDINQSTLKDHAELHHAREKLKEAELAHSSGRKAVHLVNQATDRLKSVGRKSFPPGFFPIKWEDKHSFERLKKYSQDLHGAINHAHEMNTQKRAAHGMPGLKVGELPERTSFFGGFGPATSHV